MKLKLDVNKTLGFFSSDLKWEIDINNAARKDKKVFLMVMKISLFRPIPTIIKFYNTKSLPFPICCSNGWSTNVKNMKT